MSKLQTKLSTSLSKKLDIYVISTIDAHKFISCNDCKSFALLHHYMMFWQCDFSESFVQCLNSEKGNSEKGWQKSFFIYSKWYAN